MKVNLKQVAPYLILVALILAILSIGLIARSQLPNATNQNPNMDDTTSPVHQLYMP